MVPATVFRANQPVATWAETEQRMKSGDTEPVLAIRRALVQKTLKRGRPTANRRVGRRRSCLFAVGDHTGVYSRPSFQLSERSGAPPSALTQCAALNLVDR